jgi:hypothetical protein
MTIITTEQEVSLKKLALLKYINVIDTNGTLSDAEDVMDDIEVDNVTNYALLNCFFIDTTNSEAYAVVAPHQMKDYILDGCIDNQEYYHYSFDEIATILEINKSIVENYFLSHILLDDGVVQKENGQYFVEGISVKKFILDDNVKKIISFEMSDFVEKYVEYMFGIGKEKELLLDEYSTIDGFCVVFLG